MTSLSIRSRSCRVSESTLEGSVDRGETGVSSRYGIAALDLEMLEEGEDILGSAVVEIQLNNVASGTDREEA